MQENAICSGALFISLSESWFIRNTTPAVLNVSAIYQINLFSLDTAVR